MKDTEDKVPSLTPNLQGDLSATLSVEDIRSTASRGRFGRLRKRIKPYTAFSAV